ncbi:DUF3857 domain-containing protein [Verrucomicrobiota bacterium sgz303538]
MNLTEEGTGTFSTEMARTAGAAERVTIQPPESWVLDREVDREYQPARTGAFTVLLLDEQHHASLKRCYRRQTQRLETLQAVHHAAQWKLNFDPKTQHVTIHSIAILRGDERFEHANLERFRYLQREAGLEHLILDGEVTVVALLEDVRVGDILDVSYTIETRQRLLPERYSAFGTFPVGCPVRAYYFSVRFPAGSAMKWKSAPATFKPVVREMEGDTEWVWNLEKIAPIEAEVNVPGWHRVGHCIQISDCASWTEVADAVRTNWREAFDDEGLEKAAQKIAQAASTTSARAELALRMAQDDIRYLSNNIEFGGQIPTAPAAVLRQRFGDCKDKSFLLAHLLRRLGISARPVLVNAVLRGSVRDFLPTPSAFNHAVIEYEIDGKRRVADATIPLQGGGPVSRAMPNFGMGLPISPGVEELEPLPTLPNSENFYELRETIYLDTTGASSRLRMQITARGFDADILRASLALEGKEAVSQRREQLYKQFFPDVRRIGTLESHDDRETNEIVLEELFDLPNVLVLTPDRLGYAFQYRAHLIQSALAFPDSNDRRHPFALHAGRLEHWIEIDSGALERRETQTVTKRDPLFRFSCESGGRTGRWVLHYRLQTFTDAVPANEFDRFVRKVRELWPSTYLQALVPAGVPAARRRANSSLSSRNDTRKTPASPSGSHQRNESTFQPSAETASLPVEAAPALKSLPRPAAESREAAASTPQEPQAEREAAPARRTRPSPAPEVFAAALDRTPHRRRRRRRKTIPLWVIWTAAAFVLFVALLIWLLTSFHP